MILATTQQFHQGRNVHCTMFEPALDERQHTLINSLPRLRHTGALTELSFNMGLGIVLSTLVLGLWDPDLRPWYVRRAEFYYHGR